MQHSARCTAWLRHLQLWLFLLAACEPAPRTRGIDTPLVATPIERATEVEPEPLDDGSTPVLDSTLIEEVPQGTFGPYVGSAEGGRTLALWAAPSKNGDRSWYSVLLDAKGAPLGKARTLGAAPGSVTLARIRSTPRGFVALTTSPGVSGTRVEALLLGTSGELLGSPITLVQSPTEVLWLELLVIGGVPIALWAAMADSTADVYLAALHLAAVPPAASQPKGPITPVRVVEGASAWQAAPFGDGVALVAINAAAGSPATLRAWFVDANGRPLAQTEVRSGVPLRPELDATRIGETLVVSWVEQNQLDDRVYIATLGAEGRIVDGPAPAAPFGNQRLFGILPALDRRGDGLLVWEHVDPAARLERTFQIASLSSAGQLDQRRAELTFFGAPDERPEIVRHGHGIAALTRAPACAKGAACASSTPVSTFVELGFDGSLSATEPLRITSETAGATDLAWGLSCSPQGCMALAALPLTPVPIYGVELRRRSDLWPAMARWVPDTLPRPLGMESIADGEPLAEVAATSIAGGFLVASLTQFDESTPYVRRETAAPDGRLAPLRARLGVQACDEGGAARGSPQVISYRARSPGGLALTPAPEDRALLVWTALDKQRPEVFATLLAPTGKPLAQRMLTLGAGEVGAVAAGALPLGFVVAWIAQRGADSQLFATRVSSALGRAAPDRQLSQAPGAARSLSLLVHGEETWLGWTRASDREQSLWITRVDSQGVTRSAEDVQVHQSAAGTLLSPTLVARADGALMAWIERPKVGSTGGARAWISEIASDGRPKGAPASVAAGVEDPAAIRLFCANVACQGVLDARPPGAHVLSGFDWSASPSAEARALVRRATATADPAAFSIAGAHVFYADRQRQRGLLRHLEVAWR